MADTRIFDGSPIKTLVSIGLALAVLVVVGRRVAAADAEVGGVLEAAANVQVTEPHVPIRIFNATRVSVRGNQIEDRRKLAPGASSRPNPDGPAPRCRHRISWSLSSKLRIFG